MVILPFISFLISSSITPGPNNITSASIGINYGWRTALQFICGVYLAIASMLLLSGFLTKSITAIIPRAALILKIISLVYLAYLSIKILKMKFIEIEEKQPNNLFIKGFLLQIVNPKAYIFCVTIFSTFLLETADTWWKILIFSICLPIVTFLSTLSYALLGNLIQRNISKKYFLLIFKYLMFGLMIYAMISILLTNFT